MGFSNAMARWIKGTSGNPKGRPTKGTSIADLARQQIEKHQLVEKLGSIGTRQGEYAEVDVDQQLRAIQLLLAYAYGPPRAEVEGNDREIVIQVIYAERSQIAITSAAPGAGPSDSTSEAFQRGVLRPPLGQDPVGDRSADSPGIERQAGGVVRPELPPAG
jgi:hypothetical protein